MYNNTFNNGYPQQNVGWGQPQNNYPQNGYQQNNYQPQQPAIQSFEYQYNIYYNSLCSFLDQCRQVNAFPPQLLDRMQAAYHPSNPQGQQAHQAFAARIDNELARLFPNNTSVTTEQLYKVVAQLAEGNLATKRDSESWSVNANNQWVQAPWANVNGSVPPMQNNGIFQSRSPVFASGMGNNQAANPLSFGFNGQPTVAYNGGSINQTHNDDGSGAHSIYARMSRDNDFTIPREDLHPNPETNNLRDKETARWEREARERSTAQKINERNIGYAKAPNQPMSRMTEEAKANGYNGPMPTSSLSSNESYESQMNRGNNQPFMSDDARYNSIPAPTFSQEAKPVVRAPMSPSDYAPFGVDPIEPIEEKVTASKDEEFEVVSLKSSEAYAKSKAKSTFIGFELLDILKATGNKGSEFSVIDLQLRAPAGSGEVAVDYARQLLHRSNSFMSRISYNKIQALNIPASKYMDVRKALNKVLPNLVEEVRPAEVVEHAIGTVLNKMEYEVVDHFVTEEFNRRAYRHCFSATTNKEGVPGEPVLVDDLKSIDELIYYPKLAVQMGEDERFWKDCMKHMFIDLIATLFCKADYIFDNDNPKLRDMHKLDKRFGFCGMDMHEAIECEDQYLKDVYFKNFFDYYTVIYTKELTYYTDLMEDPKYLPDFISSLANNTLYTNALLAAIDVNIEGEPDRSLTVGDSIGYSEVPLYTRRSKTSARYDVCFPISPVINKVLKLNNNRSLPYDVMSVKYDNDAVFDNFEEKEEEAKGTSLANPEGTATMSVSGSMEFVTPESEAAKYGDSTPGNRHPLDTRAFDDVPVNPNGYVTPDLSKYPNLDDPDFDKILDGTAAANEAAEEAGKQAAENFEIHRNNGDDRYSEFK